MTENETETRIKSLEARVKRMCEAGKLVDRITSAMQRAYESCFMADLPDKPSIQEIDAMRVAIGDLIENKEFWRARANLNDALIDALSDLSNAKFQARAEVRA